MMIELKPCPFCGGPAYLVQPGTNSQACVVECGNCGALHESGDEGAKCGTSWNRRVASAAYAEGRPVDPANPEYPNALDVARTLQNCEDDLLIEARFVLYQAARIEALEAKCTTAPTMSEADAKDAARYRWWRKWVFSSVEDGFPSCTYLLEVESESEVDERIDAEIERIDRAAAKGENHA